MNRFHFLPSNRVDEINRSIAKFISLLFHLQDLNRNSTNLWQLTDYLLIEEKRKFITTNLVPINSDIAKVLAEKDWIYNCFKGINLIN